MEDVVDAIGDVKTKGEVAEPAIELYDKDNNLSDFLTFLLLSSKGIGVILLD